MDCWKVWVVVRRMDSHVILILGKGTRGEGRGERGEEWRGCCGGDW